MNKTKWIKVPMAALFLMKSTQQNMQSVQHAAKVTTLLAQDLSLLPFKVEGRRVCSCRLKTGSGGSKGRGNENNT